jgi:hypothetical protein
MPAKLKHTRRSGKHTGFVDKRYQDRLYDDDHAARMQDAIDSGRLRPMAQFSAMELAALQAKAEVVLNGHTGLNLRPAGPDPTVET